MSKEVEKVLRKIFKDSLYILYINELINVYVLIVIVIILNGVYKIIF